MLLIMPTGKQKKKQDFRGGKRKGSGRKPAPYQTKTIAFRVRVEWAEEIKAAVKEKIVQLNENLL
jgi:hypothetical protein